MSNKSNARNARNNNNNARNNNNNATKGNTMKNSSKTTKAKAAKAEVTPLQAAITKYEAGSTVKECAAIAGLSTINFRVELAKAGVEVTKGRAPSWDHAAALAQLQAGVSVADVAEAFGISKPLVYTTFRSTFDFTGAGKGRTQVLSPEQGAEIAAKFNGGATQEDLAAEYGVSKATITKRLKENGVELRKGRREKEMDPKLVATAVKMRRGGQSTVNIIVATGLTPAQLAKIFKAEGLVKSRTSGTGAEDAAEASSEASEAPTGLAEESGAEHAASEVAAGESPYEAMTVKGLREVLTSAGVEFNPRECKKADLISLAIENGVAAA